MTMKNKYFVYQLLIVGLLFFTTFSCKKDKNNDDENPISKETLITHNWKLTGLENIADEWKYLNAILEIKNNQQYIFIDNNGDTVSVGNWNFTPAQDSLTLTDYGLWCSTSLITYKIILLDQNELKLMEHYTLDNKDTLLGYYFSIIN
jgi:hypothetical protein